jgi:hypothetical protein
MTTTVQMAPIPTSPDDAHYTQRTTLDGQPYVLTFRYNQREAAYYLEVALDDGTVLAAGVKVVCNIPLLERLADLRAPRHTLIAIAGGTDTSPPGIGELGEGRRVQLFYGDPKAP